MFTKNTQNQFLRFAAGGAVGTVCHYSVLMALVELLGVGAVAATGVGFLVGAIVNYVIARRFVFNTTRSHTSALPRFAATAVIGAVINSALVAVLCASGLYYLVAQVLATGTVLIWNFLVNKFWTFVR